MTATAMVNMLKVNRDKDVINTTDPVEMAVISNRFDTVCRQMTNTLLRTARSAVLAVCRDFSCSIITADNELLSAAEGVPVHVLGPGPMGVAMKKLHPDLKEGDAFLHNDPYLGNTHAADHTILVPVFYEGEHVFTAVAKGHMGDCGNAVPSTYSANARDVYEEGAIIFPCVKVQQNYKDIPDIIRMGRSRIRVPDVWYGDYLAALGAARIGERGIKNLLDKYGVEKVKAFVTDWFEYSERKMIKAIQKIGSGSFVGHGRYDSFSAVPEGISLNVKVELDGEEGKVRIDLRDNPDNVDAGVNQSETTARNNAITGVFNSIDPDVPHNAGSLRRIDVLMREGCVVGPPKFPHSCSVATTNVGDRLVNITQSAFADFAEGAGAAEGGSGLGAGNGVISGFDRRRNTPYVNQIFIGSQGGGATSRTDGWLTALIPVAGGTLYRDSVEVVEDKYPVIVREVRVLPDTGGAGYRRGASGSRVVYGPSHDPMQIVYLGDGHETPPRGVKGGLNGVGTAATKIYKSGETDQLPNEANVMIRPGEWIVGIQASGGGYGNPLEREVGRVLEDVYEKFVTIEAARDVYGVVLIETGDLANRLKVDESATNELRTTLAAGN